MSKNVDMNNNYQKMPHFGRSVGKAHQRFMPGAKPKNTKETLLRLYKIIILWKKSMIATVLLTIMSSAASLFIPLLVGKAINTFNLKTHIVDTSLLSVILVTLVSCHIAIWIIDTLNGIIMTKVTQNLVKYIRSEFFSKLQKIPLNFYDLRAHGDTMSRITNDVDNISSTVSQATTQLVSSIFSIAGTFIMMLVLSPLLTLVAVISIPLSLILTKTIAKHSRKYFTGQQQKLGALNGIIEENISGLKMVKAFNQQQRVLSDFKKLNLELCDYSIKAQIWAGFMMPFMNVINNISYALIACIGGILSLKGIVSVGIAVSFLTYSKQFGHPLNSIAGMFNNIQSALAGAERVFEIMDEDEEISDSLEAEDIINPKGKVEFCNVSFSYDNKKPILKNISFSVKPGETVALVGETGAGKTTIVNLLTRFYEINQGSILIDDIDIRNITRKSLRECFSVVLQDSHFFTGTIRDNIRYSNNSATDSDVMKAAKLAHAHDFICRLPKEYDTVITGTAENLSEGQRQLIAIARAILSNSHILILDEATSSVDTKTEKEIQSAIINLMQSRTSFLIAHRLSTIRDADKIIVIGDGEIKEIGTHNELMKSNGPYYNMVKSQMEINESY